MTFATCLPIILTAEGGFVDDPEDPGGVTNLGATKAAWEAFVGHPVTVADMRDLTPDAVAPFYQSGYWDKAKCGQLPPGLDLVTFDAAVNQGVSRAIKLLQQALQVKPDGDFGAMSLLAACGCDPATTIKAMCALREAFYRSLPMFPRFGPGWLSRLSKVQALALAMVNAPEA